jgi:hypothetical protein
VGAPYEVIKGPSEFDKKLYFELLEKQNKPKETIKKVLTEEEELELELQQLINN